jgi:hypothetical protein
VSRRRPRVLNAPIALASDGKVVVNAAQLASIVDLNDLLACANATSLPIFVGVAIPPGLRGRFVREFDDAVADVVGRLGARVARRRR